MCATVSPAFPAVNGLITFGHFSALAATVAIERATAAKDADNVRIGIMFCSGKSAMPRSRGAAALARRAEGRRPVFTKIRPSRHGTWMPQTRRSPHRKRTFSRCPLYPQKRTQELDQIPRRNRVADGVRWNDREGPQPSKCSFHALYCRHVGFARSAYGIHLWFRAAADDRSGYPAWGVQCTRQGRQDYR